MQLDIASIDLQRISSLPCVGLETRSDLPDIKGVYFFVTDIPFFQILYIGKSANGMRGRIKCHNLLPVLVLLQEICVPVRIAWIDLNHWENSDIGLMESVLIQKFNPALNHVFAKTSSVISSFRRKDWEAKDQYILDHKDVARIAAQIDCKLEELTSVQIRELASRLGISARGKVSKLQIIEAIKIKLGNLYDAEKFVRTPIHKEAPIADDHLYSFGIRRLKNIASDLEIRYYSYMTKNELVQAIRDYRNTQKVGTF